MAKTKFAPEKFISHLKGCADLAKPSKFDVQITGLRGTSDASKLQDLTFQCDSTELPGYTVNTLESKVYGPSWHIASLPTFNEHVLNFMCTQTMWEKIFFDNWMRRINNPNSYHTTYRDAYTAEVVINQYADTNPKTPIYAVKLVEAFPISIAALPVNWGDMDGVHRLAVTFKYTYWELAKPPGGFFDPANAGAALERQVQLSATPLEPNVRDGVAPNVNNNPFRYSPETI